MIVVIRATVHLLLGHKENRKNIIFSLKTIDYHVDLKQHAFQKQYHNIKCIFDIDVYIFFLMPLFLRDTKARKVNSLTKMSHAGIVFCDVSV